MNAGLRACIITAAVAGLGLGLQACGGQSSSTTTPPPPTLTVSSASPSSGAQGTASLAITITGAGFTSGATARFFRTGTTDPAGITVQSTSYVSATQLVATIDIGGTATVAQFDVQVQLTDGRSASGSGRFGVTAKPIDPCAQTPTPASTLYLADQPGHPGYFDSTFGAGTGRVIAPADMYVSGSHTDVVTQTIAGEMRIVVVGHSMHSCQGSPSTAQAVVARYLPDGTLDPTFGTGGVVRKSLGEGAYLESAAVQPDNKIVVVGWTFFSDVPNPPTVGRLNEDGTLDTTFGTDGVVMLTTPENGGLHDVAIQSDGKIVAVGYVENRSLGGNTGYIVRLQPNGEVDASYASYSGQPARFSSARIQRIGSEERLVVVGYVFPVLGTADAAVFRFTNSGAMDTSFGGTGIVQMSFQETGYAGQYWDAFADVVIDSSNRIVAAGSSETCPTTCPGERRDLALARLDEAGQLDPTFGVGGRLRFPTAQPKATGSGIAVQDDGRILVAGSSSDRDAISGMTINYRAGLWRFNLDGSRDTTFGPGGNGEATDPIIDPRRMVYWKGLALLPRGRIICAGMAVTESDPFVYYGILGRFWQ